MVDKCESGLTRRCSRRPLIAAAVSDGLVAGAAELGRYVSAGENEAMIYHGSCHCGAVQFEVEAPERIKCGDCNCSICSKSGYLHLIVPRSKFKLLKGEENLATYTFNTGVAQHKFCKTCGIKSFYIPRSNPDGYDVNIRCLEPQPKEQIIEPFDGKKLADSTGFRGS